MRCSTKKKALVKFASCENVLGPAVFAELIVNMDVDMIACDRILTVHSTLNDVVSGQGKKAKVRNISLLFGGLASALPLMSHFR